MAPTANDEAYRLRLLKRLGVIVDEGKPEFVRLAAIKAVQAMLSDTNPLVQESSGQLLDRILRPWDSRLYMEKGRGVMRPVTRPPQSLRDVWG